MFGWLKKIFKRSSKKVEEVIAPPPLPVKSEQALIDLKISYRKLDDGRLYVPGNLNISNKDLTALPDLTNVVVEGNFSCVKNHLTSLKGAPQMFQACVSDFGVFVHGGIPDHLRNPPENKHRNAGAFKL
jgi:hypothetical protein